MIYNTLTPMKNRAKILMLSADVSEASFDSIDLVMPRIGGMTGDPKLFRDINLDKWLNQANSAGIPSIPYYLLDGAYWLNGNGTDKGTVDNMTSQTSQILKDILNSLHQGGWTFDTLDANVGWKKFNGVSLMIYNNKTSNGGDISGQWQVSTLDNVLKMLLSLRNEKKFPDVKFIVWSNPDWSKQYSTEEALYTYFSKMKANIFMGISEFIYKGPGPKVYNMQLVFDTYTPDDTFKFTFIPEAFDSSGTNSHVVFHGFTADHFTIPQSTSPLELGLWCDTKDVMNKTLGFTPTIPIPPVDTDLEARLKLLEDWKDYITTSFRNL